jgi:Tol biopolymer transport system component
MKGDGSGLVRITDDNLIDSTIDLFPDKKSIAIKKRSKDYDYIYTMGIDGTNKKEVYKTQNNISDLKVSPDGEKIAFVEMGPRANAGTLYIMNIDGSDIRTLAPSLLQTSSVYPVVRDAVYTISGSTFTKGLVSDYEDAITFSTDSKKIAFISESGKLYTINIDGSSLTKLSEKYVDAYSNFLTLKSGKIMFETWEFEYPSDYSAIATISFDGSGYTVVYSTTSDIWKFAVSPDEKKLAVFTSKRIVVIVDLYTQEVMKEIKIEDENFDYFSTNLSFITNNLLMCSNYKNIFAINIDTLEIKNLTNNELPFYYHLIHAAGDKIVYSKTFSTYEAGKYYTMNIDGANEKEVLNLSEISSQLDTYMNRPILLSPDGSKFAYVLREGTTKYLYVKNSDGSGTPIKLAELAENDSFISFQWSPNGNQILYSADGYFIVNADGTNKKQVVFQDINVDNCIFSPDGSELLFVGKKDNEYKICKTDVNLSTYTILFSTNVFYGLIDWKANKIVIRSDYPYNLYSLNSDGSQLKFIDRGFWTALSPDGKKIAYCGYENNSDVLYIINSDGTGRIKIADGYCRQFSWSNDSKKLVYLFNDVRYFDKIYICNADGTNNYELNPYIYYSGEPFLVKDNKIVYQGNFDIWVGDYSPEIAVGEEVVPEQKGEIKVVVSEGGGEKGTINPESGKPVYISYKGGSEGRYTLRIFTQFGEEIYKETKDSLPAEGWFEWKPEKHLASGVYIVHIEGPGINLFKKIVILK